ncbi:MAG TPA: CPBP family intramembrane glutamic endopeptidase [Bacteroidales bacterium]|nr:CPBP family intramembrane glutamic endopeptidase [Bacteroidales bacterium]
MNDKGLLGATHPFSRLILLILLSLTGVFATVTVGMLIAAPVFGGEAIQLILSGEGGQLAGNLNFARYLQVLSHIGLFIIPSIVFAWLVGKRPLLYLGANQPPFFLNMALVALLMLIALPLVNFLININENLSLPEFLHRMETWMRLKEERAMAATRLFLEVTGWQALFFNLFMIAIIPAVGEEFVFRAIIQKELGRWSGNVHLAVWLSAILFSAMHLQFFGFLPRLALGVILGYQLVLTRNIWVPVFAHFFNNAAAVTIYYLKHNGYITIEIENVGLGTGAVFYATASLAAILLVFFLLRRNNKNKGSVSNGF